MEHIDDERAGREPGFEGPLAVLLLTAIMLGLFFLA
jgi:hypothetical protein